MGMFDTFHIQDRIRHLAVQSKQFAQGLDNYHLGDFVSFDQTTPLGVTAWIEEHKQNWLDSACPLEWVVLLLVDGCFLDAYVTGTESDARHVADVMVKLWQSPERQAAAFKRHARDHHEARVRNWHMLGAISALLRDYDEWSQEKTPGNRAKHCLTFMRHDFDKESWDWHLARLLLGQEEFSSFVPAKYSVAVSLESLGKGNTT